MIDLLLACVLIMVASLVGKLTVWGRAGTVIERNLDFLTSFSAGVFLILAYGLAKETIDHASSTSVALSWIFGGALIIWVVFKMLPTLHHHAHAHEGHAIDPRRLLISDGVHNAGDGIALAAAFGVSTMLGLTATFSIFIHELVQETSEFFVLREGGYSTRKALTLNFMVSSTILIGAIGSYFLLETFARIEAPLLGLSTGAFLVVVLGDLIPHSVKAIHGRFHTLQHLLWFVAGAMLMFVVGIVGAH